MYDAHGLEELTSFKGGSRDSEGTGEDHVVLECFFLPRGLGSRRDFPRKKRGERTLAGGP